MPVKVPDTEDPWLALLSNITSGTKTKDLLVPSQLEVIIIMQTQIKER